MFLMADEMSADVAGISGRFISPVMSLDILDAFLSWTFCHEAEACSFSLMIEVAS